MDSENQSTGNQTWQNALDPRLTQRVLRPLLQPGVIGTQLSRKVLARPQRIANRLPLLAALTQRTGSSETLSAGQTPIVYARRAQSGADEGPSTLVAADPPELNTATRPVVQASLVQRGGQPTSASGGEAGLLQRKTIVRSDSQPRSAPSEQPGEPARHTLLPTPPAEDGRSAFLSPQVKHQADMSPIAGQVTPVVRVGAAPVQTVQRTLDLPVITQAAGRDEVSTPHHALEKPLQRASPPPSGLAQPFVTPGQSHQPPEHHISDLLSGGDLPATFSTPISSGAPELRGAIVAPATAIVTSVPGNSGTGLRTPMFSGGSSPGHPGELSPRYRFQPVETTPVLRRSAEAPSTMEAGATPRSSKPDAPMAPLVLAQRAQGVGEAPEFRAPGTVALSRVGETTIIQRQAGAPDTPPPQDPPSVMDAPPATPADPGSQMDVGRLANQVYDLLVQRLARERERRGL